MSDNEIPPPIPLPEALSPLYPAEQGPITDHVLLATAPGGSIEGETHLVLHRGALQMFCRASYAAPFKKIVLADDAIPYMVYRGGHNLMVLTTDADDEIVLHLAPQEADAARRLISHMLGIADDDALYERDPEDAPTEVMESGLKGLRQMQDRYDPEDSPTLIMEGGIDGPALTSIALPPAGPPPAVPRTADVTVPSAAPVPFAAPAPITTVDLAPDDLGPVEPLREENVRDLISQLVSAPDRPRRTPEPPPLPPIPGPAAPRRAPAAAPPPAAQPARGKTVFSGADLHKRFRAHIHRDADLDAAFNVAHALVYMGKAKQGVRLFYEHHRPKSLQRTDRRITDPAWATFVRYPGSDPDLDDLLALLAGPVGRSLARPLKSFGLQEKDRRELSSDLLQISRVFTYVCQVLGVGPYELYVHPEKAEGFLLANAREGLAFVAGADMLKGRHENELTFIVARQLAMVKPQYLLCTLLPSPALLGRLVLGAVKLFLPELPIPADAQRDVEAQRKLLHKQLAPQELEQLHAAVSRIAARDQQLDLDDWFFRAHLTTDRLALLLSQDLEHATAAVQESPPIPGAPTAERRLQDLVRFCLSREYASMRRSLGLTIKIP